MRRSSASFSTAIGVTIVTLGFTALANAKDDDATVNKAEVSYADLNLNSMSGATKLYTRIEGAARNVCRIGNGPSVRVITMERECVAQAIDNAVQSVGNANLTSVYATRAAKRSRLATSR